MQLRNAEQVDEALRNEIVRREHLLRAARQHPAFFAHYVRCVDSRTGEVFEFQVLNELEAPADCKIVGKPLDETWYWQREYMDWVLEHDQTITLKGRQLGVTWVWALLALWTALFRPGADVLVYSIKEEDAAEVIGRIWDMFLSLPEPFKSMVTVIKPTRGVRPSTRIEFEHPDGRVSTITGMVATKSAGHGRSAALVVFDEASRQEYARELWKAVVPAMGDKGGKLGVVSTANGMSDGKGQGNFFHELWVGAGNAAKGYPKLQKTFLGWFLHPDRNEKWYGQVSLPEAEKAEQYPNDADEAFLLSGTPFFSSASLRRYAGLKCKPVYTFEWVPKADRPSAATMRKGTPNEPGIIEVYEEPQAGHKYAIGADVATGTGADYSAAYVIDLMTGKFVAQIYMKGGYERYAEQLHFTGLWYRGGPEMPAAWIAIEKGGGYGDTVIAYLRDGLKGRRPYPRLYRFRPYDRPTRPETEILGFPMNSKTRPKVINELRSWIEDGLIDAMPPQLYAECLTFVHRETNPSPRAQDGANDDCVMAAAVTLELYSEKGEHEHDRKKVFSKTQKTVGHKVLYPWKYD